MTRRPLFTSLLVSVIATTLAAAVGAQTLEYVESDAPLGFDGITVSPAGNPVLAGGWQGQQVVELLPDGSRRVLASGLAGPTDLAYDATGALYVSEFSADSIRRIAPDGEVTLFARVGQGPAGLDVDSHGNLYVSLFGTGYGSDARVARVAPDGEVTIVASGGGLFAAIGVAVDARDRVYAANWHDGHVFRVREGAPPELVGTLPVDGDLRTVLHLAAGGDRLFATTHRGLFALSLDGVGLEHVFQPGPADADTLPPRWGGPYANGLHASRDGRVLHLGIPWEADGTVRLARLELAPADDSPLRIQHLLEAGHAARAAKLLGAKLERGDGAPVDRLWHARALFRSGEVARAAPEFDAAAQQPTLAEQAHYGAARCRARLGELDAAFASLDASLAAGQLARQWMLGDPELAPLRADRRWVERAGN